MPLFLTASSFYSIFTVPWTFNSTAGRFLEAYCWRCHSSSGFSLTQFVRFLHVTPDRLMMIRSDLCVEHWLLLESLCKQKSHWIITINGKMNVWKCKLIFPTGTLQQKIEITDLKPFLTGENTSVLIILATTVCIYSKTKNYSDTRYNFWYFFLLVGAGHYSSFM